VLEERRPQQLHASRGIFSSWPMITILELTDDNHNHPSTWGGGGRGGCKELLQRVNALAAGHRFTGRPNRMMAPLKNTRDVASWRLALSASASGKFGQSRGNLYTAQLLSTAIKPLTVAATNACLGSTQMQIKMPSSRIMHVDHPRLPCQICVI